jgi:putative PIN family toxin of toxin-antitoxin system
VKIVLDTNVLIAAHAAHGLASSVFELCLREHTIVISSEILRALAEGLLKKIAIPPSVAAPIIELLKRTAEIHKPSPVPPGSCRDADDLHVLGLAVSASADRLITGDGDLLILGSFRSILIISPRQFWDEERRPKSIIHERPLKPYRRTRTLKNRT